MDETRDPNKDENFFLEKARTLFNGLNLPMFTEKDGAIGFINAIDPTIDALVNSMKESGSTYSAETILLFGSALGEAFRLVFNGRWHFSDKQNRWVIFCKTEDGADVEMNIFHKIEKRIENGMEDSILYYYESTEHSVKPKK